TAGLRPAAAAELAAGLRPAAAADSAGVGSAGVGSAARVGPVAAGRNAGATALAARPRTGAVAAGRRARAATPPAVGSGIRSRCGGSRADQRAPRPVELAGATRGTSVQRAVPAGQLGGTDKCTTGADATRAGRR